MPYYFRDQAQIDKYRAEQIKVLADVYHDFGRRLTTRAEHCLGRFHDKLVESYVKSAIFEEEQALRAQCLHAASIPGPLVTAVHGRDRLIFDLCLEAKRVILQDVELDRAAADLVEAKRRLVAYNMGQYMGRSILKKELRNLLKLTIDYDIWSAQTRYQFYLTNGNYVWLDTSSRRAKHRLRVARLEYLRTKILRDSRTK